MKKSFLIDNQKSKESNYILGLCYSHDASVCLLKDGVPVVAIQKERLSRKKHDGSITDIDLKECVEYCLAAEGITLNDIDLVVENSPTILYCKDKDNILGFQRNRFLDNFDQKKIIQISHHLAHAYAAFGMSPYREAAVLVVDGQGNYKEDITENLEGAEVYPANSESSYIERESFYCFQDNKYRAIRKNLSTIHKSFLKICGLGHLYESVASYVFRSRFDAGKLMGLAAYGEDRLTFKMVEASTSLELKYNSQWVKKFSKPNRHPGDFELNQNEYKNLAYRVQKELEQYLVLLTKWFRKKVRSDNLCYSGGVALNCSANQEIAEKSGFKNLFISPPANDGGVSVGCAYYGYLNVFKKPKKIFDYLDYLGKPYEDREILKVLKKYSGRINYRRSQNISLGTAKLLKENKIVAWFQGGSEFGPRALGNRSIICNPCGKKTKDILNLNIKFRESFRPFAPSVLEEKSRDFFTIGYSPYMLLTAKVRNEKVKLIPAVTHVDQTARIQTVNPKQNKKYYRLIKNFEKISGMPLILNTSFNTKGEPIVETPEDAVKTFINSKIDYLSIGNFIVAKR